MASQPVGLGVCKTYVGAGVSSMDVGKGVGRITPGVGASVLLVPARTAGADVRKREIDSFMVFNNCK